MQPIRILFNTWADRHNVNSQSLTARELAIRLNPKQFISTFFITREGVPDERLNIRDNVRLVRIPKRLGSFLMAGHMLWGKYDIFFYPSLNLRATAMYWKLKPLERKKRVVENVECSFDQILAFEEFMKTVTFKSIRGCDDCFAITPMIAASIGKAFGKEIQVIPLGVDLSLFKPAALRKDDGQVRIIYVASIQPRKQPHLILELARALSDRNVRFDLIGPVLVDPAYAEKLYRDRERYGLENVHFHGPMVHDELCHWLRDSDIYILPSRLEGFGKTTIEAAASGLPAIIFSDYQSTTVKDGVTGFQVNTFEQMNEKLELLIDQPQLRRQMGKAAVEYVQQFDWNRITEKWEDVLRNMVM